MYRRASSSPAFSWCLIPNNQDCAAPNCTGSPPIGKRPLTRALRQFGLLLLTSVQTGCCYYGAPGQHHSENWPNLRRARAQERFRSVEPLVVSSAALATGTQPRSTSSQPASPALGVTDTIPIGEVSEIRIVAAPPPAALRTVNAPDREKKFADENTLEIGLATSLVGTGSIQSEIDASRRHEVVLHIFVGYFSTDPVEWVANATIHENGGTLSFGVGYFFHFLGDTLHLGPEVSAGWRKRAFKTGLAEVSQQGPCGFAGLRASVPFARRAIFFADGGLHAEFLSSDIGSGVNRRRRNGTEQGAEAAIGLSFFF